MVEPEMEMTCLDGRPVDVLNQLIAKRSEVLKESTRDAVVATMIDVLVSLRSATMNALKRKKFEVKVEDTGWFVGYTYPERTPCFRSGVSPSSPKVKVDGRVVWLTAGLKKQADRHVYRITTDHELEPYYIAAGSQQVARTHAEKAMRNRIRRHGGVARNALGVAMVKISTRNVVVEGSMTAKNIASSLSKVRQVDSDGNFSISMTDELKFATEAVKNGESAIQTALMKSANKVAGILKHHASSGLKDTIVTPFPEVKRRK